MTRFAMLVAAILFVAGSLEAPPALAQARKDGTTEAQSAGKAEPKAKKLVDLNTAALGELKTLPGITDAEAKKIIANRPFRRKEKLVNKEIISQAKFDKIKDLVFATPPD